MELEDKKVKLLKLGDFGLACEVTKPLYTVCGTPTYVAPEILAESGYGLKVRICFNISVKIRIWIYCYVYKFEN